MKINVETPGYPFNNFPNAILLPGGLPIKILGSEFIGGIGISGATSDEDEVCAQAGLNSI